MVLEKLFELATPYLKKNDFGVAHTRRVFEIARAHFDIPKDIGEITLASIVLHDIGGSTVKEQYEKGPDLARGLLSQLEYGESFIQEVCEIIRTHHNHPENPSLSFKVLYDSDRLVMFSHEEFPHYNSRLNFNWDKVITLIYHEHIKNLARRLLLERKAVLDLEV
jgi:hypothetical protein